MSLLDSNKFILNLASNGVIPTKKMTPHVPITPSEVVSDIELCMKEGGITYLHLHARDNNGVNSSKPDIYKLFIEAVKNKFPDLPICVSCSGRLDPSFESRSQVLNITGDLKPDMASLTLSSLNFTKKASINEPDTIIKLAQMMVDKGIKPELEIFDIGMMNFAQYLIRKGILKPPFYFNIILGNLFSAQAKASHLAAILQEIPENSIWSLGGIGASQTSASLLALSQGGGIRTGIEDNIWYDKEKKTLASNPKLVKRIHQIAEVSCLTMMKPKEFSSILEL